MNKEVINIVTTSDNNYAQPLSVSIYSMMDNFSSENYKLKISVLDGGITNENKNKIERLCKKFNTEIVFIKISNDNFINFPLIARFTTAIYYRLLIPKIFDINTEKVIYLDSDILVLGNVAKLYEINIDNFYIGAVKDFISNEQLSRTDISFYKYIKKMFNAGLLVMNLKKMREDNFVQKSFDFTEEHADELPLLDQDILNFICKDNWLELDKVWNYQMDISQEKITPKPNILHYTNSYKPWHRFYYNYYQKDYKKYLKKAWPDYKIKPVPFKVAIKQLIKHIPFSVYITRKVKSLF